MSTDVFILHTFEPMTEPPGRTDPGAPLFCGYCLALPSDPTFIEHHGLREEYDHAVAMNHANRRLEVIADEVDLPIELVREWLVTAPLRRGAPEPGMGV